MASGLQDWVDKLHAQKTDCSRSHTKLEESEIGVIGENTYCANPDLPPRSIGDVAANVWWEERKDYAIGSDGDSVSGTGHFATMVWKDTKYVGCARSGLYVLCRYNNRTHPGQFPRNVKKECSSRQKCESSVGWHFSPDVATAIDNNCRL